MSMIQSLLEYQKVDKQIYDMEKEVVNSNEGQKLFAVKLKGKQIMDDIQKMDKTSQDIIKKFKELEDKITKLTGELNEYDGIVADLMSKKESEYCLKKIKDLITQIDAVNKQIDDNNRYMDKILKNAEKAMKEYNNNMVEKAEREKEFNELRKSYMPKVQELNNKLNELKDKIDSDVVEKYQNLRRKNITQFPLVVELKDTICQGCFLEAVGAEVKMKETGKEIVECPSCGRLVYIKK